MTTTMTDKDRAMLLDPWDFDMSLPEYGTKEFADRVGIDFETLKIYRAAWLAHGVPPFSVEELDEWMGWQ